MSADLPTFDLPANATSGDSSCGYWSERAADVMNSADFMTKEFSLSSIETPG
jgi:hypothetical protein